MMIKNKKQFGLDLFWLTVGTVITAFGVYLFKIPNNFSTGGMSGISIILGNLIKTVSPATFILILNIFFMILGFLFVGKSFGWKTIYCSLLYSGLIQLLDIVMPISAPFTNQRMLELFFAMGVTSFGTAIAFKHGGSTGGTDIIAMIIRKHVKADLSYSVMIADALIAGSAFIFIDVETGLYSVFGMLIKSFVVQAAVDMINRRKTLLLVTSKPDEIIEYITNKLHRGATVWHAEGAFTECEKTILFAVMTPFQAANAREYAKKIDSSAFVTILNSSEIYGKGFMSFTDDV